MLLSCFFWFGMCSGNGTTDLSYKPVIDCYTADRYTTADLNIEVHLNVLAVIVFLKIV